MVFLETGKHKGKTLRQVYDSDFNYFIWLKSTDIIDQEMFDSFDFNSNDYKMTFGKYTGMKISDISKNDKGYFKFLCSKKDEFTNAKLKESIDFYSK